MSGSINWEDAFSNADYIADAASYRALWTDRAEDFRQQADGSCDVAYGESSRQKFDLFLPNSKPEGLAVFVHGGFWLDFDKSSWTHLARGALSRGWATMLPSYDLAPDVPITEITRQVAQAISTAAEHVSGPIHLAGHSAGGHLVTRMVCANTPLSPPVAQRIERVISISGVHDLRPLLHHSMNDRLQLDGTEASAESPVLQTPLPGIKVTAWVGALERPEFLRQSALLREAWSKHADSVEMVVEPERHHFDVIDGLANPEHPLSLKFT